MADLHALLPAAAVSLKPELFEGCRFDFNRPLSPKFALTHRYAFADFGGFLLEIRGTSGRYYSKDCVSERAPFPLCGLLRVSRDPLALPRKPLFTRLCSSS
jgi:hypothetical protein